MSRCTCETVPGEPHSSDCPQHPGYGRLLGGGRVGPPAIDVDEVVGGDLKPGVVPPSYHPDNPPTDQTELPGLTVEDFRRVMASYLNSAVCMSLFSTLTLLRAQGENPEVRVVKRSMRLRVSMVRSNGEVMHFNRDGGT